MAYITRSEAECYEKQTFDKMIRTLGVLLLCLGITLNRGPLEGAEKRGEHSNKMEK